MHIVYAVTTCTDRLYKELFSDTKNKPAFQSQKYHRLLIEGLSRNAKVDVVATLPLNSSLMLVRAVAPKNESEGGADYTYVRAWRNPLLRMASNAFGVFFKTFFRLHKGDAVIIDVLNRVTGLSALLAARLRGVPCVGIVTDLPDMLGGSRFSKKLANAVISACTNYVFLTEAMNTRLNPKKKPYVILEGHCDSAMETLKPDLSRKTQPRVCMYAGGVSKQYGLDYLVEGFRQASIPNCRLDIYGPGDYVPELVKIADIDRSIRYGGMLFSSEIVEKEMEASLLINPRPTHEEFVKYSFPSKTMEYMASGTPVLTTDLPGMPEEYHSYVNIIADETPEGLADALKRVLSNSDEELFLFGDKARRFVLERKNNIVQAAKIISLLNNQ